VNWCIIPSMLHIYIHLPSILPNLDSEYSNIKKNTQELSQHQLQHHLYIFQIWYV